MPRNLTEVLDAWDADRQGRGLHDLIARLHPICRSITGEGVRQSLRVLQQEVPLTLVEVPTGTKVFDWTVPKEWNIREAWIKNGRGEKVVDFARNSLHVVSYSIPVRTKMTKEELSSHVFTLPSNPGWIPYRTSYYKETWGFCFRHSDWESLPEGEYEVCIDSTLQAGALTYGELLIEGETQEEVLISCHSCHPSMCNDNLSGMSVAAKVARCLADVSARYSYRFLWVPGTIGSITWLAGHESRIPRIKHGLVLSCVGDPGGFTYKRSRRGNCEMDRAATHVLLHSGGEVSITDFTPLGYDERQYCSPGINLPMGCLMRTPNGKYPQYHTSADDLTLVTAGALAESALLVLRIIFVLENNRRYLNLNPKCEPQLGRRGLYRQMGGMQSSALEEAILWVLNSSDGSASLLDIADRSGIGFRQLAEAAGMLEANGILRKGEA